MTEKAHQITKKMHKKKNPILQHDSNYDRHHSYQRVSCCKVYTENENVFYLIPLKAASALPNVAHYFVINRA